jgi:hypothetical protein
VNEIEKRIKHLEMMGYTVNLHDGDPVITFRVGNFGVLIHIEAAEIVKEFAIEHIVRSINERIKDKLRRIN